MPTVNVAPDNPFSDIPSLAIAISGSATTRSLKRRHLGIFFRPDGEDLQLIHLGWHDDFHRDSPDEKYCWVPCKHIDPVVLDTIADWLSEVWKANGSKIPYSIKPYDTNPFDDFGKLISREPGDGFTCATFVMWVFYHSHIELIDKGSWKDRRNDKIWRQWIIDMLNRTHPGETEHIEAQSAYIDHASRFRPEEVAGAAATFNSTPLKFGAAVKAGKRLTLQMRKRRML